MYPPPPQVSPWWSSIRVNSSSLIFTSPGLRDGICWDLHLSGHIFQEQGHSTKMQATRAHLFGPLNLPPLPQLQPASSSTSQARECDFQLGRQVGHPAMFPRPIFFALSLFQQIVSRYQLFRPGREDELTNGISSLPVSSKN